MCYLIRLILETEPFRSKIWIAWRKRNEWIAWTACCIIYESRRRHFITHFPTIRIHYMLLQKHSPHESQYKVRKYIPYTDLALVLLKICLAWSDIYADYSFVINISIRIVWQNDNNLCFNHFKHYLFCAKVQLLDKSIIKSRNESGNWISIITLLNRVRKYNLHNIHL